MNDEFRAVYISPVVEKGDDKVCAIEEVIGLNAGKKYPQNYTYHKSVFGDNFHGTLIMFCKNNVQITDTREILQNFDVKMAFVTAFSLETLDFYANDGVIYNFEDNYFCRHNRQTFKNMVKDLETCKSFYIHLVIEKASGRVIDITLIVNPQPKQKFAYDHRIVKGLVPTDLQDIKKIGQKVTKSHKRGEDKLSQSEIDQLIADFYTKDRNIRLL